MALAFPAGPFHTEDWAILHAIMDIVALHETGVDFALFLEVTILSQPSLFLFLKRPATNIETIATEGVPAALRSWKEHLQAHPRASGLVFAGYHPPLMDDIEEMLEICEGVLLIAESARWLAPESFTNDSKPVAKIPASVHYPEMVVYEGSDAWGHATRDVSVLRDMIFGTWKRCGTPSQEKYLARLPMIDAQDPTQISQIVPAWALDVPVEHLALSPLCLRGLKGLHIKKISDLWRLPSDHMVRSYGLGETKRLELAEALRKFLASGPDYYFLTDGSGQATTLMECVLEAVQALAEPDRHILRARLALDGKQATAQALADKYGLTNGRVRQVEKSALLNMPRAQRLGQLMRQHLAALLHHRTKPLYLDRLDDEDAWFQGFSQMSSALGTLFYYFAEQRFYLWEHAARFVIARISQRDFSELKTLSANLGKGASNNSTENDDRFFSNGMGDGLVPENALDLLPLLEQE